MSEVFHCDDKETLVAYLYDEVDGEVRREVERHLRQCVACARERDGLQMVRGDLQGWLAPEPERGFAAVPAPPSAIVLRPAGGRWHTVREWPAWAQVAAASLVFATAAAIANIQVRTDADGLIVTTGWMQRTPPVAAAEVSRAGDQQPQEAWRQELTAFEQRWQRELGELRAAASTPPPAPAEPARISGADADALLRRVRALNVASEERLRQELASRFLQAERMWNVRRQADLQNINRSFGSLQNRTFAVQANQQEVINQVNQLRRVNLTQPNQ